MPDTVNPGTQASAETAIPVHIAGLDHVVLRVESLDRAIAFYETVLGCRIERELQQPRLVQLRAGTSLIDLVPLPPTAQRGAGNMDHFALRLEAFDAEALAAHLRRHGIEPGAVH